MNRYIVAFVSVLVGVAVMAPFAVLRLRDLPLIPAQAANAPPPFQQLMALCECCVVFYAVTYWTAKRVYARFGTHEDLRAVRELSGAHTRALHSLAGAFMVAAATLDQPVANKNPITTCVSITIGLALLCSGFWGLVRWARSKMARKTEQPRGPASRDQPDG